MQCRKCGNQFKSRIIVDGKVRHLQNRKFCLDCSPFGQHNTKNLIDDGVKSRNCGICGKEIVRKDESRVKCWSCSNKISRELKIEKIQKLTGKACWICGYDKCWQALDFHHVHPDDKLFPLTVRELQFGWDKIEKEVKKCVLLCCRCHREVHYELIAQEKIIELWNNHWDRSSIG